MSYILRHNLTGVAMDHLLQIFNEHFPGLVPATSYLFHKSFGQYGEYVRHFYCHHCSTYIGTKECGLGQCMLCQLAFDVNFSLKNGSYFLAASLSTQIKEILEKPKIKISGHAKIPGYISDIQCGREYRKFKDSGEIAEDDISLLWNCDGIPVFKSSKCQIWPIQCQIIEWQPADQKKNICVPCLWFGESKPNIQTLLIPFVKELQELQTQGITWGKGHTSKVYALICSADSVARPLLQNTKQFNGMVATSVTIEVGVLICMLVLSPVFVMKLSILNMPWMQHLNSLSWVWKAQVCSWHWTNLKMVQGFVPEYQHSVCLGVTRQLATLWLDSTTHNNEWYIGTKTELIDKELTAILPPTEFTRVTRSIKERKFWKASEWQPFLLFYSLFWTGSSPKNIG